VNVIVGLGNPGPTYVATRHNIGFMVLDRLARDSPGDWRLDAEAESEVRQFRLGGSLALLVKPQTYMNHSGRAVSNLRARLGFEPQDMTVVLDDAALEFGRLRIRKDGGDGGHNGLASIIEATGSQEIARLRLGIGPPPEAADLTAYVLGAFSPREENDDLVARGCAALKCLVDSGIDAAMNSFNS
jgi:PTH1 family peptidyl-tRNA hydrolase